MKTYTAIATKGESRHYMDSYVWKRPEMSFNSSPARGFAFRVVPTRGNQLAVACQVARDVNVGLTSRKRCAHAH